MGDPEKGPRVGAHPLPAGRAAATSWTTCCRAWSSTPTTWRSWWRSEPKPTWRRSARLRLSSTRSCPSEHRGGGSPLCTPHCWAPQGSTPASPAHPGLGSPMDALHGWGCLEGLGTPKTPRWLGAGGVWRNRGPPQTAAWHRVPEGAGDPKDVFRAGAARRVETPRTPCHGYLGLGVPKVARDDPTPPAWLGGGHPRRDRGQPWPPIMALSWGS